MGNIDLKDIISKVKQPVFDEEMIEKLVDGLINSNSLMKEEDSFYTYIQRQTALSDSKSKIDRDAEQELFEKKTPLNYDDKTFQHMGSLNDIDYCISRLYINCDQQDLMKFANLFTDRCRTEQLPTYFKYVSNNNSYRSDQIVIYSNLKDLANYIQILQEIGEENPEIVERCGNPPLLTGKIDKWIGIGDEPINRESYTQLRSNIIYKVLKENVPQKDDGIGGTEYITKNLDYDRIREELRKAFNAIGINIDKFAFNNANLQLYMSDEQTRLNYDTQRKQSIRENKEIGNQDLRERLAMQELKILNKLGVMPEAIECMINATSNRNNFFNDLYKNKSSKETIRKRLDLANNIVISDEFELQNITETGKFDLTDKQREEIISRLINDTTNFYVEYVNEMVPIMDSILNQYTELLGQVDNQSREKLIDLDSKLKVLANGKVFFEAIGVPDEKLKLTCDKADSFLNEIDKQMEEKAGLEGEKRKSEIDRELLSIFFEESGITGKEDLRKLYESWENFEVSTEDLEAVLSNFESKDYSEKTGNISNEETKEATEDDTTVSHKLNKIMGTTYEQITAQQTKTASQSFRESVSQVSTKKTTYKPRTTQQNRSVSQSFRESISQDSSKESTHTEEAMQQTKTPSQSFRQSLNKTRSDRRTGMRDVEKSKNDIALRREKTRLTLQNSMGQLDEEGKIRLEEINRMLNIKNINLQQYDKTQKRTNGQNR